MQAQTIGSDVDVGGRLAEHDPPHERVAVVDLAPVVARAGVERDHLVGALELAGQKRSTPATLSLVDTGPGR